MRFLTVLLLSCGVAQSVQAASIRAMGMGSTTMGYAQDSLTNVVNPALAVDICNRIDVGLAVKEPHKQLAISNREGDLEDLFPQVGVFSARHQARLLPEVGINYWWTGCAAIGLAWTNDREISTWYRTQLTDFSGVSLTGEPLGSHARFNYRTDVLTATFAFRFNPMHSLGLGINAYGSRLRLNGLNDPLLPSSDPQRKTDRGWDDAYGVGVTIGWTGYFCDCLTLGASVTPKVRMSTFSRYKGFLPQHRIDIPTKARAGLVYQVVPCLILALDGEYCNYSKVRAWNNYFFKNSTTGFNTRFGDSDGPGFGFRDEWTVKAGAEWRCFSSLLFRVGYRNQRSPLRKAKTRTALNVFTLETVENFLSVGGTWEIDACAELSVFGEWGLKKAMRSRYPEVSEEGAPLFLASELTFREKNYRTGISLAWNF